MYLILYESQTDLLFLICYVCSLKPICSEDHVQDDYTILTLVKELCLIGNGSIVFFLVPAWVAKVATQKFLDMPNWLEGTCNAITMWRV